MSLKKVREEIGLLAQTVETRSVNLDNLREQTTALCMATQEKCEAAAERLAKLTEEIGQQADTKAIVESIRKSVDAGVRDEVIQPFMQRTEELSRRAADVGKNQERERGGRAGLAGTHWKMALTWDWLWGCPWRLSGPARHISNQKSLRPDAGRTNRFSRKDAGTESGRVLGTGRGECARPSSAGI